jgi:hypothetical protein
MAGDPRRLAGGFADALRDAAADRLQAAALFGSAARGEWIDGISDVNVLVLVDRIDGALLARCAPAVQQAMTGGVAPLVMERDEWNAAADVFAIEVADMQQASVALFGENPAAGLVVHPAKLRLQAERELRARLVQLHGAMLLAAGDGARLGGLLVRAMPSFATYLRAALRLAGHDVPASSRDAIAAGCGLAGADARPLLTVHDARCTGGQLHVELHDTLADDFNEAAKRLVNWIDEFGR